MKPSVKQRNVARRQVSRVVLAFFFVQAFFPAGYMPAALSSGWFLQLCPTGVSPAVMAILHGDQHAYHHNPSSDHDQPNDHTSGGAQREAWRVDCPFSAFTSIEFAGAFGVQPLIYDAEIIARSDAGDVALALAKPPNNNQPRAPPGVTYV